MKEEGIEHWNYPNEGATNESGFTALPSGYKNDQNSSPYYRKIGTDTWFWSSTQNISSPNQKDSYATHISKSSTEIKLGTSNDKYHGFPVRCLQD